MIECNDNIKVGVLFDLDGVLIDSEREYTRIWSEIDRRYPTGVENFAIKIKGQTLPEILSNHYPETLHSAVIDMLNERGIDAVLVTSSNNLKMKHLREEQPDLESHFAHIITANDISRSKPDPEGYLLGANKIGVAPKNCVVFEDSAQGVKAGKSAGAYVVGLTTTLPAERIAPYSDRIVGTLAEVDLDEIIEILKRR